MEIENTNGAAVELESKVRVRVTNVLESIKDYRKTHKTNFKKSWIACAVAVAAIAFNAYFDYKNWLWADIVTMLAYVAAFIALINYDSKATTARGKMQGAYMVLETLLPEAFLEDDKTTKNE